MSNSREVDDKKLAALKKKYKQEQSDLSQVESQMQFGKMITSDFNALRSSDDNNAVTAKLIECMFAYYLNEDANKKTFSKTILSYADQVVVSDASASAKPITLLETLNTLAKDVSPIKLLNPAKLAMSLVSAAQVLIAKGIDIVTFSNNNSMQEKKSNTASFVLKTIFTAPLILAKTILHPFANVEKTRFFQRIFQRQRNEKFKAESKQVMAAAEQGEMLSRRNSEQRSLDQLFERKTLSTSALTSVMPKNASSASAVNAEHTQQSSPQTDHTTTAKHMSETSSRYDDHTFDQSSETSWSDHSSRSSTPEDESPLLRATKGKVEEDDGEHIGGAGPGHHS